MPPTIGVAIRRITCDPLPTRHMIGSKSAIVATILINFGRTRSMAPSTMRACKPSALNSARLVAALFGQRFKRLVQVDQHEHTGSAASASNGKAWSCGLFAINQLRTDSIVATGAASDVAASAGVSGENTIACAERNSQQDTFEARGLLLSGMTRDGPRLRPARRFAGK